MWKYLTSAVYLILLTGFLTLCVSFIPSTDTQSAKLNRFTYRGPDVYNTTYFPWSNFCFYWVANVTGFIYVNASNMNMQGNLLHSGQKRYRDFVITCCLVPFIFFVAPIIVLRGEDNLSSTLDAEPYETKAVIGFNALWFLCFFIGL